MLQANDVLAAGTWDRALRRAAVTLDFDRRCRRRIALKAGDGTDFLLDLPRATRLRQGDGLLLESGAVIEVQAAPEPLLELRCADADALVRLAWHLGNRHVPTELRPDGLRIRVDHVLAELAQRLGADVTPIDAPFEPEGGAYEGASQGHHHHHDHGDHHDHDHDHGHHHDDGHRHAGDPAGHDHPHAAARASWR